VPMGQQTTIAYIAPDSSSQMTFYVQKPEDSCVGANCSTYLTDWNNGSGNNKLWAANLSPSLNSQIKAGQHWTMTVQNAGLGYYGYLDSPSGQGLPSGSGSTPAGAQFKLETQAEINAQPPWAVALEEILGTVAVLVGIGILTGGIGDAEIIGGEVAGNLVVDAGGDATANVLVDTGAGALAENVAVDPLTYELVGNVTLDGEFAEASYIAQDGDQFGLRRVLNPLNRVLNTYFLDG